MIMILQPHACIMGLQAEYCCKKKRITQKSYLSKIKDILLSKSEIHPLEYYLCKCFF